MYNTECWKRVNPYIPCQAENKDCWEGLMPPLPCSLRDQKCWDKFLDNKSFAKGTSPARVYDRAII